MLYYIRYIYFVPVLVAVHSKALLFLDRSNTGIVGLNPSRGMMYVRDLLWHDVLCRYRSCDGPIPHSGKPTKMSQNLIILIWNRPHGLIREKKTAYNSISMQATQAINRSLQKCLSKSSRLVI
jgi:hypothetical protein